jgi:hypothetical protein
MIFDSRPPGSVLPATAPKDMAQWREPLNVRERGQGIPSVAQIPPFWQLKPPGGIDIQATGRGVLPAGAGASVLITGGRPFLILPSYNGVLAGLTFGVLLPLATLDITVTLLQGGAPVQGWDNFSPPNVGANAILQTFSGPLQLPQSTALGVLFTNNAASGPWDVNMSLSGWMWPQNLEAATFGVVA